MSHLQLCTMEITMRLRVSCTLWQVCLLPTGDAGHPSCYEAKVDAPGQKIAVLNLRCAATRPNKGDAVCAMVPMRNAHNHIDAAQGQSLAML